MIWHFLEVWLLVALTFTFGSALGALLYSGLARGRLADAQGAMADAVGDLVDGAKSRFGAGPAWRPGVKRAAARTSRESRQLRREADFGGALRERFATPAAPRGGERVVVKRSITYWEERERSAHVDPEADDIRPEDLPPDGLPPDFDLEELVEELPEPSDIEALRGPPRAELPAMRPAGLAQPRNGVPDNLQRIRGIGRRNEQLLNSLGIFHFGQIAAWTPAEARWVAAFLAFPERIERDDWVGQATILASGGDTGYVKTERRRAQDEEDET